MVPKLLLAQGCPFKTVIRAVAQKLWVRISPWFLLGALTIDFCQKNCNSMRMAHALADHVFFISTNQMQPRCQSCVEFNGEFRGWHPFLLILNPLEAVAKSKCGKLLFSIIATTWQHPIHYGQPGPHVTAPKTSQINSPC